MAKPQGPSQDWLAGGGEQGEAIRAKDWSSTALGPTESWPQSLRTTVSLCLASNFPINIIWGSRYEQIYNEGYRVVCGSVHPKALGWDFRECWASAWPAIGEPFERALTGETQFLENQPMFLERNDYLEETFFTFGFSPIRDESGGIGGLFHPVTETTEKMLAERRTRALRDLTARAVEAKTTEDAMTRAAQTLAEHSLDLPFVLIYLVDEARTGAQLVAQAGLAAGAAASPAWLHFGVAAGGWPITELVHSGRAQQVDALDALFGPLGCGPYPESPKTAFLLPVSLPGSEHPDGFVIAGASPRLPLNESYRAFFDLIAAGVAAALANARAYETERRRAEALAAIDRAKTAFFSNISHEFRTPLTLMLGPIEELASGRSGPLLPSQGALVDLLQRNSQRLLRLVNALLDFSKIEAGRMRARFTQTDLVAYTEELASQFHSAMDKAGLNFSVECLPLRAPVYVDPEMWEKIVVNLLSNALKFTLVGTVRLCLQEAGGQVRLTVADSGAGIPKDELPKLFQRFHRVQGTRSRSHEGTGIGLAMTQELVRQHGGEITVDSQEGRGSTFTVTLQQGRNHLPADQIVEGAAAFRSLTTEAFIHEARLWLDFPADAVAAPVMAGGGPRVRVLLADDNADLRAYVSRLLGADYQVQTVVDGQAALDALRARKPDLLLTDVMMPRLDGMGLLKAIRADPELQTLPVIMLSARAGEEAALEGLDAGADDYLIKPFSAQELLARVRTHLQMAQQRNRLLHEAARVNRELESFSYSVSHDLRAPLRSLDGFSQALLEDNAEQLDATGKDYLQRIRSNARHMGQLIDDLLRLARISRAELRRQDIDLGASAHAAMAELRKLDPQRAIDFTVEPGLRAQGDPGLVRIVLDNLLGNAWKYTRQRTPASIRIGREYHNGETEFFVQDNGAGFDMRYVDKLFGVFQRLHAARDFEGTGIGLVTVKRIVERHGGSVSAIGVPGDGATFYFSLPG